MLIAFLVFFLSGLFMVFEIITLALKVAFFIIIAVLAMSFSFIAISILFSFISYLIKLARRKK